MTYEEKQIKCRECNQFFAFTVGEQMYFSERGLVNEPKRCPNCRVLIRLLRSGKDTTEACKVNCATCGVVTTVPFQPRGYKPVYCNLCMQEKKAAMTKDLMAV